MFSTYLVPMTVGLERLLVKSLSLVPHFKRFTGFPSEALFLSRSKA